MGLKINKVFILIFLILLQSCSGGRIGTFLESSFKNIEKIEKKEDPKNNLKNKKVVKSDEKAKKNIEKIEKKEVTLNKIKVLNNEEKLKNNKITKNSKSFSKIKFKPQSYKIIVILKDVDPKDPIEDFSTILRNSEVNFEIEKIERFFDSKNKNIKTN